MIVSRPHNEKSPHRQQALQIPDWMMCGIWALRLGSLAGSGQQHWWSWSAWCLEVMVKPCEQDLDIRYLLEMQKVLAFIINAAIIRGDRVQSPYQYFELHQLTTPKE